MPGPKRRAEHLQFVVAPIIAEHTRLGNFGKHESNFTFLRLFQKNIHPREVAVTGQEQLRQPAIRWPVTVTLDIYLLAMA